MPCECAGPGYCPRHKRRKTSASFMLCKTSPQYFNLFEAMAAQGGTVPIEIEPHAAGIGDVVARATKAVGISPCGGCKKRKALLNYATDVISRITGGWVQIPIETHPDLDYDLKWSIGVTTAARGRISLDRSLVSLHQAGWDVRRDVLVFAEPEATVVEGVPTLRREDRYGAWRNWFESLRHLVESDPDADAYIMLQDDVLYAKNIRQWLERSLWPDDPEKIGFVSLYTSGRTKASQATSPDGKFHLWPRGFFWGACAYVFPPESARLILADADVHRHTGNKIDVRISRWCDRVGRGQWYVRPSLCQHLIDVPSTLGHGLGKGMYADDWPGMGFDVNASW